MRAPQRIPGANHVGYHCLGRVSLEHRHVFVSGGVKHDVRALLSEQAEKLVVIGNRYERFAQVHAGGHPQLFRKVEKATLVVVEKDDPARTHRREQPAELRPNRSGGTCYEHSLVANLVP